MTDTGQNIGNLDAAATRGNPTDLANIEYAKKTYGYTPSSTPAGTNTGTTSANALLPSTPSLSGGATSTASLVPSGVTAPNSEADIFNLLTRDALLRFQGVNTADLEKKKRALQLAAIGKTSEITPEELRTFSPSQQASIRSGDIAALQPEFDDVAYQLNKAQQATANFENVYEKVMAISEDYAAKMVAPDSVIANYKQLIEADPNNINTYLAKVNDKTRDAILQSLDYSKLNPAEPVEDKWEKLKDKDGNEMLINLTTKEMIRANGASEPTSVSPEIDITQLPAEPIEGTPNWARVLIGQAAKDYGVPASLISAVINQESGFNPDAANLNENEQSYGLGQINLNAHPEITKAQATDVGFAVNFVAQRLKSMIDKYGLYEGIQAYNTPGAIGSDQLIRYADNILSKAGVDTQGLENEEEDDEENPIQIMNAALNEVVGSDGFVSPQDYAALKQQWVEAGLTPTEFDTKFKGFRNPENKNYNVGK